MGKTKMKRQYAYSSKTFTINLNNVRIGGAYGAMQRAKKIADIQSAMAKQTFIPEREEYIKNKSAAIKLDALVWFDLCNNYELYEKHECLTKDEYYEIAKCAVDAWPEYMADLRTDKMTDMRYYELCKIMASHGVFQDVDFIKANKGNDSGVYRVAQAAIGSFGKIEQPYMLKHYAQSIRGAVEARSYMTEPQAARVLFHLWLIVQNPDVSGVLNLEIANLADQGLIGDAVAGQYVKQLSNASQTQNFSALLAAYSQGNNKRDIPVFCKRAYYQIADIYKQMKTR